MTAQGSRTAGLGAGDGAAGRAVHSLLVFVQRGLQQAQRVHQPRCEAQLLSCRSPQPRARRAVLVQLELLLRLFADQLRLWGREKASGVALRLP